MGFLRRDFSHPEFSSWRKRDRALTRFYNAGGQLIAAYSYNTALAVVLPDADQRNGSRIYLNRTTYSKGSTKHFWEILRELRGSYGEVMVDGAADSYSVPVGTSVDALADACGRDAALPSYVRSRPLTGHVHLTLADRRRYFGRADGLHVSTDGDQIDVLLKTRDGDVHMIRIDEDGLDISTDLEDGDYTLSPELYRWLVMLRGKAMGLATARGSTTRHDHGRGSYLDLTYSKRTA